MSRRVAVVGTGASAAQIVPELAKVAEQVDVYQRTPQWILPRRDKPFTDEEKERFATDRQAMEQHREEIFWAFENTIAFRVDDNTTDGLKEIALSHIDYRIKDETLKAKLTPDYPFGCKRTLICSDFYKAVLRDNVELITERIERVTPTGIVAGDGQERPVDAIVLATGFKATEYLDGMDVSGVAGGRRLHDDWAAADVAHAYLGLTVSGYPNFFMFYGPNTNQGGNSIIVILEAQAAYVVSALDAMEREGAAAVEVRRDVMEAYNVELAEALEGTVWHHGCQSYFKNAKGKIATQLPQTSLVVHREDETVRDGGVRARMKAAVYYETGTPDVFRYEDVPDPVCGPGDILIDVEAVSIEGGDTLHRLGGDLARVPHIVGYQGAGTVAEIGADVAGFAVGDRAVTVGLDGSHAERRAVPAGFAWKIPDGVSTDDAACVPVPFGTADDCLFEFGRLQAGETALVHAGAGGVGHRRHPDGQAGRRPRAGHGLERRPPGAAEGPGPRRRDQLRHPRLRGRGAAADRRPRRRRHRRLGGRSDASGEHRRPGLPGSVCHRGRRRACAGRAARHLDHAAQQPDAVGLLPRGGAPAQPPARSRHDRRPPRGHRPG